MCYRVIRGCERDDEYVFIVANSSEGFFLLIYLKISASLSVYIYPTFTLLNVQYSYITDHCCLQVAANSLYLAE